MDDKAQLVVALANARAAIDNLLVAMAQELPTEEAPAPQVVAGAAQPQKGDCPHTNKQDMRGFGQTEHWLCRDCGYEFTRR